MNETKKKTDKHSPLQDAVGLALIVLGGLLGASAFMYIKDGSVTNPGLFTAVMSWLVEAVGPPAILWLCLGFLFVGGRLFAFGSERGTLRDPIGFVATALGLSILMGAFRPESIALGGHWGQFIGGRTSEIATVAGGVALGLASLLIPAWVVWLRVAPPALVAKVTTLVGEDPAPGAASGSSAQRTERPVPPTKKHVEDPSGVTSAEADALLPDPERDEILNALRSANRQSASTVNHAPSPYPADVRREGGIPAGARPIETNERFNPQPEARAAANRPAAPSPAAGAKTPTSPAPVRGWNAPRPSGASAGDVSAGADLAAGKVAGSSGASARATPELKTTPAAPSTSSPVREIPPQSGGAVDAARALPIASVVGPVGVPTWETEEDLDELAVPEVAAPTEELVVDAYGTPLELVAALRAEPAAGTAKRAPSADADDDGEEDETPLVQESTAPWAAGAEEDEELDSARATDDALEDADVDDEADELEEAAQAEEAAEDDDDLVTAAAGAE
ncbi:MAG TPA: hypothetical protein VM509_06395, partial [Planctomycetota bacterium]|nr:hypothetical protein [Planctomycetota bacterium]